MMKSIISQAEFSARLVQGHGIHNCMLIYHYSLHGGPAVIPFLDSVSPHLHAQTFPYIPPPSLNFKTQASPDWAGSVIMYCPGTHISCLSLQLPTPHKGMKFLKLQDEPFRGITVLRPCWTGGQLASKYYNLSQTSPSFCCWGWSVYLQKQPVFWKSIWLQRYIVEMAFRGSHTR